MIRRRHFLAGLTGLSMPALCLRSLAAAEANAGSTIIVAIQMLGGNDGLNTVVPLSQYGAYTALRTPGKPPPGQALAYTEADLAPLAFNANPVTAAGQATQFAFAPGMAPMRSLYASGHLAVIAGVGLPYTEMNALSHYNAQLDWATGQINRNAQSPSGWLRLALANATSGKLGATVSLGGATPLIAAGTSQGLVLSSPIDNYGVYYAKSDNYYGLVSAFGSEAGAQTPVPAGNVAQAAIQSGVDTVRSVAAIAAAVHAADYPAPVTALDYQLRDIARLIIGGAGITGYTAVQLGYDTHVAQALTQPRLIAELSTAMANFYAYLQSHNASSNVVIMTFSDFGRRPGANLDFGTDHGAAGVCFALGDPVTGGVYGTYPSLTSLDANHNLMVNVDFRNVLSDIIIAAGGNAASILGGSWPSLGFV
jgi:uncharacterized protein (DUF1501 family)